MILRILQQAFPFSGTVGSHIRTAAAFGLFVFLFLFLFRPFGLQEMPSAPLARVTFYYGGVCCGVLLLCFLVVPFLLPWLFREEKWTVWKEILYILGCTLAVSAGNIFFTHFYFGEPLDKRIVLKFGWFTFSVALIPITVLVLTRQNQLMKTFSRQAGELDRQLPAPLRADPSLVERLSPDVAGAIHLSSAIRLTAENQQEVFLLDPAIFLYAEAADNYIKIHYQQEGRLTHQIFRSSLKRLEEAVSPHDRLYRCHRAYLVNLDKVIHISGNAQGYKLHLEGLSTPLPVSRNLNKEIAGLVTRPKDLPGHPSGLP